MDWSSILLIGAVVLLIGISKSAFAGALGVFAVPLLLLQFSSTEAIALLLPILMIADGLSLKSFWRHWDSNLLLTLIPGALCGLIVAHLTIDLISSTYLRNIIAVICITFALKNIVFHSARLTILNNRIGAFVMAASSGITSTLVHAGGPPLIMYFTAIGLPPRRFVATAIVFYAALNLVKFVGFSLLGLLNMDMVLRALAFLPVAILGNRLGLAIHGRLDTVRFLRVMNYLLLMLGVWLIFA